MKKELKFIGAALAVCVAMISCENDDQDLMPEFADLKSANNGMIKSYENAVVVKWNEALSLAINNKMPPATEARIYVIVTLAVHDALNNVVPKFETYALDNSTVNAKDIPIENIPPVDVNDISKKKIHPVNAKDISKKNIHSIANAAVAQAAHDAMVALVPASAANAGALLTSCLAEIEESDLKSRGIQIGKDAAIAVLAARQSDPPLGFQSYPQGTLPGEYRSTMPYTLANPPIWPEHAVYAPNLGTFRPFGIETGDQFRVIPPFDVSSPEYAADFNEVKILGGNTSTERTQEESDLAVFFLPNISNFMNHIARTLAVQEQLDGWETARLLALTHITQFDAHLSAFDAIYHYNRWRPVTAIRMADSDGNDLTTADPAWNNLQAARATPPTPSYPSAHAEMGGAGAELFKLYFKKDFKQFTLESFYLPGAERSYTSFSHLSSDISISRIYTGFQFRNDVVQAEKMGRELARYVFRNNLRVLR